MRFALHASDEITRSGFFLVPYAALTLNEHETGQRGPILSDVHQVFRIRNRPATSRFNASMAFVDGLSIIVRGILEPLAFIQLKNKLHFLPQFTLVLFDSQNIIPALRDDLLGNPSLGSNRVNGDYLPLEV